MRIPEEGQITQTGMMQLALNILTTITRQPTVEQWQQIFPDMFAFPCSVRYGVNPDSGTTWMLAWDTVNAQIFYAENGIQNFAYVSTLASSMLGSPQQNPVADPFWGNGRTIVNNWVPTIQGTWQRVFAVGHSIGGANAAGFLAALQSLIPTTGYPPILYTFGSPKYATRIGNRTFQGYIHRRFYFLDDPVPQMPPRITSLEGLFAGLTENQIASLDRIITPSGGYALFGERPQPMPLGGSPPTVVDATTLSQYYADPACFPSPLHALARYAAVAQVYAPLDFSRPDAVTPPTPPSQPAIPPTQVATLRDEIRVASSIVTASDPQAGAQRAMNAITPIAGVRFRAGRANGHRVVTYAGQLVCWTKTRRLQRSMVRFLNKQLAGPLGVFLQAA